MIERESVRLDLISQISHINLASGHLDNGKDKFER